MKSASLNIHQQSFKPEVGPSVDIWSIDQRPGHRQYQVFIHVHILWLDETQLGSGFPHDTDGPACTGNDIQYEVNGRFWQGWHRNIQTMLQVSPLNTRWHYMHAVWSTVFPLILVSKDLLPAMFYLSYSLTSAICTQCTKQPNRQKHLFVFWQINVYTK